MTDEEFEQLYLHRSKRLVGQLYLVTGDLHEAQDVVQEAFVRAWSRRRKLDRDGAPETWIRTTAWRLAISRWRRRRRALDAWTRLGGEPQRAAVQPGPETVALAQSLRRLPPRQRQAVFLFYLCDLSVAQIAAETGTSTGSVKTHLSRGRAALAPHLTAMEAADD
ncbi:SigE family RNA polymerase sigma factor [Actinomadura algeriensis]|uniref:RNA polymerase sigma-70 factor (ECF subfamily) n=1 Tax=Actinomadura algeriensis TaxID=1679523 RepID=A0ABR9JNB7_9ACTN|nr:SigE family RNA polymerase sigma factor [Actinomadura algeriensis]MBE1531841.1 RNA polymerase sigma-70 factor (ECF subfamily) [Actinomadura algeriensis]